MRRFSATRARGAAYRSSRTTSSVVGISCSCGDHAGDETVAFGFVRGEAPTGEQHVARERDADVLGEDRGVIRVGDAASQLGRAEHRALARDRDVGEHGDEQPAAHAQPVDRGDDGLARVADRVEGHRAGAEQLADVDVAVVVLAAELAAGREHVAGPGHDESVQRARTR